MTDLKALAEAATPGPWKHIPWHIEDGPPAVRCDDGNGHVVATTASEEDAAFIAAARNLVLALYAERDEALMRADPDLIEWAALVRESKARAALSAAHAEPVAWRTKRHPQEIGHALTDAGMTADEWRRRGFAVEPLFTRPPSEAAIRADERAATCKEGLQVEEIRQAILDHCWGDSNGNVNGSILAAEAIATAIRARGGELSTVLVPRVSDGAGEADHLGGLVPAGRRDLG